MPIDPTTISELENELVRFPPTGVDAEAGNRTVRRTYVNYISQFLTEIRRRYRGYTTLDEDGSLLRYLPWKDPTDSTQRVVELNWQAVNYEGRDDSLDVDLPMATLYKPTKWAITAHYSSLPYPLGDEELDPETEEYITGLTPEDETTRYCVKVPNPGREFINPPTGQLYLEGSQYPIPVPMLLPFTDLEVTWFQIPVDVDPDASGYPSTAIAECLGRVNSDTMTLPSLPDGVTSYAPETVHLIAVRPQLVYQSNGSWAVNLTYGFRHRGGVDRESNAITWNTFPNANRLFKPASVGGPASTTRIFDTADFRNLFRTEALYTPP